MRTYLGKPQQHSSPAKSPAPSLASFSLHRRELPSSHALGNQAVQRFLDSDARDQPQIAPSVVTSAVRSSGQPLEPHARASIEPRFGLDFSRVRIHTDGKAAESARAVSARAYTVGHDIVFGSGQYAPGTQTGRRLLAHELTHVAQQGSAGNDPAALSLSPTGRPQVQRKLGDGHDLKSPRFSKLLDLEAAFDKETVIRLGRKGRGVQALQQALYDLGFPLPVSGADSDFGGETKKAVQAFQRATPPLTDDGEVGQKTMEALDTRFSGAPALPAPAVLAALWTDSCVRSVICPWSPHTIDVLRNRITLKSFDSISWADEKWDGAAWVPAPFPGGGYHRGNEIGIINASCDKIARALYHEVLHSEQPTSHTTTLAKESYAYRIGEEFSIMAGLAGRPSLRSTDPQGRQFADPAKVNTLVTREYPSVPAGGGGEQIIGKGVALGEVRVQRPNATIYTRPAVVGEKVPGPITTVNEATHPTVAWTCP